MLDISIIYMFACMVDLFFVACVSQTSKVFFFNLFHFQFKFIQLVL